LSTCQVTIVSRVNGSAKCQFVIVFKIETKLNKNNKYRNWIKQK